jgi:hypothetical protein
MSRWRSTLRFYVELRQRYGIVPTLQQLADRALSRILYYERLDIIVLERAQLQPLRESTRGQLTTRLATLEDLHAMRVDSAWDLNDTIMDNFQNRDWCLLSYVDGCLAGYTWVHSAGHPEIIPGLVISIPSEYLYNYAGFTHPKFRGCGLQPFRHHVILSQPETQQARGILGYVTHLNFASRRGQSKSGYKTIGTVRLLGWTKNRFAAWFSSSLRKRGIHRIKRK